MVTFLFTKLSYGKLVVRNHRYLFLNGKYNPGYANTILVFEYRLGTKNHTYGRQRNE
jgi:hypothetical protein